MLHINYKQDKRQTEAFPRGLRITSPLALCLPLPFLSLRLSLPLSRIKLINSGRLLGNLHVTRLSSPTRRTRFQINEKQTIKSTKASPVTHLPYRHCPPHGPTVLSIDVQLHFRVLTHANGPVPVCSFECWRCRLPFLLPLTRAEVFGVCQTDAEPKCNMLPVDRSHGYPAFPTQLSLSHPFVSVRLCRSPTALIGHANLCQIQQHLCYANVAHTKKCNTF